MFLSLLVTALIARSSQSALLEPAPPSAGPTGLVMIADEGTAITLKSLKVSVFVSGPLVETTLLMTFFNHDARTLEGRLQVPLPDGSTVCAFAVDVHGEMIDAVPLERSQAELAYEQEVQLGHEAGITKWAAGNAFRTRIYPLPPHAARTARLVYVSMALDDEGDSHYVALPLQLSSAVERFSLSFNVNIPQESPQRILPSVKEFGSYIDKLKFSYSHPESSVCMAEIDLHETEVPASLVVLLPHLDAELTRTNRQLVVEKRIKDPSETTIRRRSNINLGGPASRRVGADDDSDDAGSETLFALLHRPSPAIQDMIDQIHRELGRSEPPASKKKQTQANESESGGASHEMQSHARVPIAVNGGGKRKALSYHIRLFWDASLSRLQSSKESSYDFLRELVKQLITAPVPVVVEEADDWNAGIHIEVYIFRSHTHFTRRFRLHGLDAEALIDYLKTVQYDGGTSLDFLHSHIGLSDSASPSPLAEQYPLRTFDIVFSDGLVNLHSHPSPGGPSGADSQLPRQYSRPVFCVTETAISNFPLLHHVALLSGGAVLDLTQLSSSTAVHRLLSLRLQLLSVHYDHRAVAEVYPRIPQFVHKNRGVVVTGKLLQDVAKITLNYGIGSRVLRSIAVTVTRDHTTTNVFESMGDGASSEKPLVSRFWAQHKAADLMIFPKLHRKELTELGIRYGIVTPGTSLVVLESLDQYLAHGIVPPLTRPEMRAQYERAVQSKESVSSEHLALKKAHAMKEWKELLLWYNTPFEEMPNAKQAAANPPQQLNILKRALRTLSSLLSRIRNPKLKLSDAQTGQHTLQGATQLPHGKSTHHENTLSGVPSSASLSTDTLHSAGQRSFKPEAPSSAAAPAPASSLPPSTHSAHPSAPVDPHSARAHAPGTRHRAADRPPLTGHQLNAHMPSAMGRFHAPSVAALNTVGSITHLSHLSASTTDSVFKILPLDPTVSELDETWRSGGIDSDALPTVEVQEWSGDGLDRGTLRGKASKSQHTHKSEHSHTEGSTASTVETTHVSATQETTPTPIIPSSSAPPLGEAVRDVWAALHMRDSTHDAYRTYMHHRQQSVNLHRPEFYLDCAELFLHAAGLERREEAVRILSNVLELDLANPVLSRVVGFRLLALALDVQAASTIQAALDAVSKAHQSSETSAELSDSAPLSPEDADALEQTLSEQQYLLSLAVNTLRQVLANRPQDLQSYRDLATALSIRSEILHKLAASVVTSAKTSAHGKRGTTNRSQATRWTLVMNGAYEDLKEAARLLATIVNRLWDNDDSSTDPSTVRHTPILNSAVSTSIRYLSRVAAASDAHAAAEHLPILLDLNNVLRTIQSRSVHPLRPADIGVDSAVMSSLELDLRLAASWDPSQLDVEIRVTEPSGEIVSPAHSVSKIGGELISDHKTHSSSGSVDEAHSSGGGSGHHHDPFDGEDRVHSHKHPRLAVPGFSTVSQEYLLRHAPLGSFNVHLSFTSSHPGQPSAALPSIVHLLITTDFGRPHETRRMLMVRLPSSPGHLGDAYFSDGSAASSRRRLKVAEIAAQGNGSSLHFAIIPVTAADILLSNEAASADTSDGPSLPRRNPATDYSDHHALPLPTDQLHDGETLSVYWLTTSLSEQPVAVFSLQLLLLIGVIYTFFTCFKKSAASRRK